MNEYQFFYPYFQIQICREGLSIDDSAKIMLDYHQMLFIKIQPEIHTFLLFVFKKFLKIYHHSNTCLRNGIFNFPYT